MNRRRITRARVRRVAVTTSYVDLLVYSLILFVLGIGLAATLFHNLFGIATATTTARRSRSGIAASSRSRTTRD